MARRLLIPTLAPGPNTLPPDQAHHARDVLRMSIGQTVELFTPAGHSALATLTTVSAESVIATVTDITPPSHQLHLTIASAIPKAARADWMIEKLSELGVSHFIPLQTERSVVHPEGKSKLERWERLAEESAKQSHRTGVMKISLLTPLPKLLPTLSPASTAILSTGPTACSILKWLAGSAATTSRELTLLIGPEGGWSPAELATFDQLRLTPLTLGATILRVETAAIAAAAIVAMAMSAPA